MASGLEALLHRPRPSAWQLFWRQPCVYLARLLYSWRQTVPAQPITHPVSVVCVSDTHNSQPPLPDGDVLIHAGDLTQSGSFPELEAALAWLRSQPHAVKIVVAGNHDGLLDAHSKRQTNKEAAADQRPALDWGDIVYLENAETTILCPGNDNSTGRQLRIYGSPWSPRHGNWAFQYPRSDDVWAGQVPLGTDILITHGPPRGHLDLQLGCVHLLKELWRVQPRLHVFGHVHEGAGTEWVQFDALQAAYEQTVVDRGGIVNLGRVLLCFLRQRYFGQATPAEARCLLVNPCMVGGLRDDERRKPVQVVL